MLKNYDLANHIQSYTNTRSKFQKKRNEFPRNLKSIAKVKHLNKSNDLEKIPLFLHQIVTDWLFGFLYLMTYQSSWIILYQSSACRRKEIIPFNP